MNIAIRKNRFSTTSISTITIPLGDLIIDITKPTVVVGDGVTVGGIPLAHEVHTHPNATTSTAGFMAAGDKLKLNSLSLNGGYQVFETNGTPLPPENIANFSTDFTITDNSGAATTEFSLSDAFRNEMKNDMVALILALS